MPMRGALRAAIVVTQHVAAEITFKVAPHRVDVVAARVVELDEEVRALDAKVVRLTRLIRSSPADLDRIEWSRAHTREARFSEFRLQVIGERADQFQHLCLLGGVHLRERQPHRIERLARAALRLTMSPKGRVSKIARARCGGVRLASH